MKTNTKMIAASLSLITSFSAVAGMGGVNVQSNLGEPFSGSIVVTGQEAQAVLQNGASVSGSGISGSVAPHGGGNAIIRLRSNSAVNDPILTFTVRAGNQTRQYTAMINPSHYRPNPSQAHSNRGTRKAVELKPQQQRRVIESDDIEIQQETAEVAPRAERTHAASPRYHRVHSGENLASIAARYRPHGMSVQRAMRALMAANSRAFRNGRMYRNVTLYIPTASQFHAYAKSAQRKHQSPRISRGAAIVAPAVTENTAPDAVETTPSKVVTPPPVKGKSVKLVEPVKPQAEDKPAAVEKPIAEKPVKEEPAKPVEPAKPEASKPALEENKPAKPEASPVEEMQPEKPAVASDSQAASVETASVATPPAAEEKPEPQQPEPQPTPPAEEPAAEEGLDWTLIGGGVAGAAVVGLGAAYLLGRRKKSRADAFDDDSAAASDDEFDGSDIQFDGTASPETDDWMLDANVEKTDEVGDDFFDLPPDDTVAAPAASSQSFDLDSFEPEPFDDTSDEWAVSDEAETETPHANPLLVAENATSFDANDWQVDDIVSIEPADETPAVSPSSHSSFAADDFIIDDTPIGQPETAVSADDDFLSFDDSSDDIIPAPAEEASFDLEAFNNALPDIVDTPAPAATASSDDFLDFDASDIVAPAAATAAVAAAASHVATPDVALDDFSLDKPAASSDFDLDVPAVAEVAPTLDAPEVPEFSADLDAPAIAEPAMDFTAPEVALDDFSVDAPALDAPVAETPAVDNAMDFALDDFAVETPAAPAAEMTLDDGLDFALADEPVAEPAAVDFGLDDAFNTPAADFAAQTPTFEPVEQPFADLSLEEPAVAAPSLDDLSFDEPAAPVAEPAVGFADDALFDQPASAPSFDDLAFDEPAAPAPEQAVDDLSSWDMAELPETPNNDAGFVSEAVGLTEPLEAKLELAKMYLEIDDAVAARETLRELVTESNGDIQAQAQQLLDELGG